MKRVEVYEVGLRDGLQNEAAFVPSLEKIGLAGKLADAGLRRLELTSFVSPKWIPQLADHEMVARDTPRVDGVQYSALVPNKRGLEGAVRAELDEIAVFMSATDTHSKKNINKSVDEAIDVLADVAREAQGHGMRVRGYLSVVFGCPYEGEVDPSEVRQLCERLLAMGVYEVSLGDTIGIATPKQVRAVVEALDGAVPLNKVALHMHDTRGTALANVVAGLDLGIRTFDSAFGGLGGCPYAPGASGNLATEDLVYLLEGMDYDTGIDLDRLAHASEHVAHLIGRPLPSRMLQTLLASPT